jgi:hypothetical protein
MTKLEITTRLAEIIAEMTTNEEHSAAIREQAQQLMTEISEEE